MTTIDGRVTELVLAENRLKGEIPSEIGALSEMTLFVLWNNELTGTIPPEIGGLSSLREMYIGVNQLSGELPREIGQLSKLEVLSMSENSLTGSIPSEIGQLTNLRQLLLDFNDIAGNLPPAIGKFTNLTLLNLWGNQLSGPLPPEVGDLVSLKELNVASNNFTGKLPNEFAELQDLEIFYGVDNRFSGELPRGLSNLNKLRILSLWGNNLTGNIPAELGQLSKLEELSIFSNRFEGGIPAELAEIPNLRELSVGDNNLSGCVVDQLKDVQENDLDVIGLVSCGERESLVAIFNSTDGENWRDNTKWLTDAPLSEWFGVTMDYRQRVVGLDLSSNRLTGTLTPEIENLTDLRHLVVFDNELSGEIPAEVGDLPSLSRIFVTGNSFEGCIPDQLANIPSNDFSALGLPYCTTEGPAETDTGESIQLVVFSNSPWRMNMAWMTNLEAVTGYEVLRDGEIVASLEPDQNTFAETGLDPDTAYVYEIRSQLADGSAMSAQSTVATLAHSPVMVDATDIETDGFDLPIWDEWNSEATVYRIVISDDDFETTVDSGWGTSRCVTFSGLNQDASYSVGLHTRNQDGVETLPVVTRKYNQVPGEITSFRTQPRRGNEDPWSRDRLNDIANIYFLPDHVREWLLSDVYVEGLRNNPSLGRVITHIEVGYPIGPVTLMHEMMHAWWEHWSEFEQECDRLNIYAFRREVAKFMVEFRDYDDRRLTNPWEDWRPFYAYIAGITRDYMNDDGEDIWDLFEKGAVEQLYDVIFHELETEIPKTVKGNLLLVPPPLRGYFTGFLAKGDDTTWREEIRWYTRLPEGERRLWDIMYGYHAILYHSPHLASSENARRTSISPQLLTILKNADRRQLVDFVNTLADVACEVDCMQLWEGEYAYWDDDVINHLERFRLYSEELDQDIGVELGDDNLAAVIEGLQLVSSDLYCGQVDAQVVETSVDAIIGITDDQRATLHQIIDQLVNARTKYPWLGLECTSSE